jgi:hypothetical protein
VASKDSRNLVMAVVVLVAFAAMMAWALIAPDSDTAAPTADEEPTAPGEPTNAAPAAATKAAKTAPAKATPTLDVDLFAAPMPDFMTPMHARTQEKQWLDVSDQKQLYEYGQQHKDDARPQLLLAWDSMNREWYGIAVRMYRIAYHADKRAKYDPSMLRDLLWVAARYDRTEYREAVEIIREAYGEEALPRIDEELAAAQAQGASESSDRLQRLRSAITGG